MAFWVVDNPSQERPKPKGFACILFFVVRRIVTGDTAGQGRVVYIVLCSGFATRVPAVYTSVVVVFSIT